MSSSEEEFVPPPQKKSRCHSKDSKEAASQDDPIPGPSQETNHIRCPKCLRFLDSHTEFMEHMHDHENTGEDRIHRCKKCDTENIIAYVHYEGYYVGDPKRRVIGMHCEECLNKIFGKEDAYTRKHKKK